MPNSDNKLSPAEKFAYGLGDAGANLVFQTQLTFLMFFYTNVLGIRAGTAGTILLVSRIVDAFNDPIIGALADRTNSRWGRYRPWVLWTAIPMAVALVLCYTAPPISTTGKIVWAIATYNLLMFIYAANNIPYCALSGVMTTDSRERTSLASWRFVCAMAAALVVNVFTVDLVERFGRGNAAVGYPMTMAVFGALAILFFAITFAFTKERVGQVVRQGWSIRRDVFDLWTGPWLALFVLAVLVYIQLAMRSASMLYYFNYYLRQENVFQAIDNFGVFNGVGLVFTIIGVALAKPLVTQFGKRTTFQTCLILSSVLMAAFALVPPDSFKTLLVLQMLLQLIFGPTIPILWAMMADVADYLEWSAGRRSTALAFASIIFAFKLGNGIGSWLNGQMLEHFGYSADAALSTTATSGIVMMISVVPAIFLFVGAAVMFLYRLDDRLMNQIEQELSVRRNEAHLKSPNPSEQA